MANTSATNDTDGGLTNGTTYYYVVSAVNSAGESANSSEVSATPMAAPPPVAPSGLNATAGNAQVSLAWNASSGATSYNVKRATTSGGPYTKVAGPATTSDNDSGLTNGTTYYYVVSAVNSTGESANSAQVSATPAASGTSIQATIDVLTDRHAISPYVYGGSYPANAAAITDSGLSVVRWGGNGTSTYNWKLGTNNADNDYYFEDFDVFGNWRQRFGEVHQRRQSGRQLATHDDGDAAVGGEESRDLGHAGWDEQLSLELFDRKNMARNARLIRTTPTREWAEDGLCDADRG